MSKPIPLENWNSVHQCLEWIHKNIGTRKPLDLTELHRYVVNSKLKLAYKKCLKIISEHG